MFPAALILVLFGASAFPPAQGGPTEDSFDLEALLDLALAESRRYREVFENLTAEETQERVVYDDEARVSERRTIVSDLIVYRSALEAGTTAEYRSIREVDGQPIEDAPDRQLALTADLSSADAVEEELARIREESSRYDIGFRYNGLSLTTEKGPYRSREIFDVELAGMEVIEGRELILLRYRQTGKSPRIQFNFRGFPDEAEFSWRGTVWLDAETGELWRSEDEVVGEGFRREPVVLMRQERQYQESSFGILVPERFEYTVFGGDDFDAVDRSTLEYGPFRRFGVDVELGPPTDP